MGKLQVEEDISVLIENICTQGDQVIVEYFDGHEAIFEPYSHGWGYQCEGLRSFTLLNKGKKEVFLYHSRLYREGPRKDEHKIVYIDSGYSQKKVAKYWRSVKSYLSWKYSSSTPEKQDELWWPWRLICGEGWVDFKSLEEDRAEMLKNEKIN